jgi:DNA polymerase
MLLFLALTTIGIYTLLDLEQITSRISTCTLCKLSCNRNKTVPGEGSNTPNIMFIGEAPGFHEDQQGRPFIGRAGTLLEELLLSIGLNRSDVFITNMVKCRPINNRDPSLLEIEACRPFLEDQIKFLNPKIIVTLGRHSLSKFFPTEKISNARGKPKDWQGRIIFPIYHPAAALYQNRLKAVLVEDFNKLADLVKQ